VLLPISEDFPRSSLAPTTARVTGQVSAHATP
jgi:hypothetical protein